MKHRITFAGEIDASHEAGSEWPYCPNGMHGHKWGVYVDFRFDPLKPEFPQQIIEDLLGELQQRHLNDMIRPSAATPFGLASWIMERLLPVSQPIEVEVQYNGWGAVVEADEVRRK